MSVIHADDCDVRAEQPVVAYRHTRLTGFDMTAIRNGYVFPADQRTPIGLDLREGSDKCLTAPAKVIFKRR